MNGANCNIADWYIYVVNVVGTTVNNNNNNDNSKLSKIQAEI